MHQSDETPIKQVAPETSNTPDAELSDEALDRAPGKRGYSCLNSQSILSGMSGL